MSEGRLERLFEEVTAPISSSGRMPGFAGATGWLNSAPLGEDDLRGRVVLTDFWTYTCINWLRTLGWVRAWAERYADQAEADYREFVEVARAGGFAVT